MSFDDQVSPIERLLNFATSPRSGIFTHFAIAGVTATLVSQQPHANLSPSSPTPPSPKQTDRDLAATPHTTAETTPSTATIAASDSATPAAPDPPLVSASNSTPTEEKTPPVEGTQPTTSADAVATETPTSQGTANDKSDSKPSDTQPDGAVVADGSTPLGEPKQASQPTESGNDNGTVTTEQVATEPVVDASLALSEKPIDPLEHKEVPQLPTQNEQVPPENETKPTQSASPSSVTPENVTPQPSLASENSSVSPTTTSEHPLKVSDPAPAPVTPGVTMHDVTALSEDKPLAPRLLFVYPPQSASQSPPTSSSKVITATEPLPPKLLDFCFPDGVRIFKVAASSVTSKLYGKNPTMFVFTLTNEKGGTYGICAVVLDVLCVLPPNPASPTKEPTIVLAQRCYCLLSHFPFLPLLNDILAAVVGKERLACFSKQFDLVESLVPGSPHKSPSATTTPQLLSPNATIPVNAKEVIDLIDFCYTNIRPPRLGEHVLFRLPGDPREHLFRCPKTERPDDASAIILAEWGLSCLFQQLPLDCIIRLLSAILCERSIIVICNSISILTSCVLALVPLMRPLTWQGIFVPVLPSHMQDCFDAPVPFIIGTQTLHRQHPPPNCIVVDLQNGGKLTNCGSPLPNLPEGSKLVDRLKPFHSKLFVPPPWHIPSPAFRLPASLKGASLSSLLPGGSSNSSSTVDAATGGVTPTQTSSVTPSATPPPTAPAPNNTEDTACERATPKQLQLVAEIQTVLREWMGWLMHQVTATYIAQPTDSVEDLCTHMTNVSRKENKPFLNAFLQTQLFSVYTQHYLIHKRKHKS
ncbi:DeoxyUTP pyrophosphatase, dUTPase subfamily [Pelomyxa schiedti]|nr:DeoxyUTP pyrophosphatase, dUTPase subfamily [Pelomyxa schiedti]